MTHLSEEIFGTTTEREGLSSTVTVDTSPTKVAPANPNRVQLTLINPSGTAVWVDTSGEVSTNDGFLVPSSNGSLTFNITEDGSLPQDEFNAIVGSGTVSLVRRSEVSRGPVRGADEGGA